MTDRRRLASNGRVAHVSLRGQVEAGRFVEGARRQPSVTSVALLSRPDGARARELVTGEVFVVLDDDGRHSFGFAERDGYCGYVGSALLYPAAAVTHRVVAARSYRKAASGLKDTSRAFHLSFGSLLRVVGERDGWAEIEIDPSDRGEPARQFVPAVHLAPVGQRFGNPADVAELLLGTPYLWGGNSAFGIDCSGLVQAACLACGIPCPGDSDMQAAELGRALPPETPPARGDLLFWKGHVAIAADAATLIHANAYHMAVAFEPIEAAIARIAAQGDGPVTSRRRP